MAKPIVVNFADDKQSETDSDSDDVTATRQYHRPRTRTKPSGLQGRDDSPAASPSPPSSASDGEDLAKSLAMQFYKIELGEQRRLMGVMEHHSMESRHVVEPKSAQLLVKAATVGGLTTNGQGVPSGGLCGPVPTLSADAPIAKTVSTNEADHGGQTYTGTAAARMLSGSASEGGMNVPRSVQDHGKAFPFSITAGVEKGDKNRYASPR